MDEFQLDTIVGALNIHNSVTNISWQMDEVGDCYFLSDEQVFHEINWTLFLALSRSLGEANAYIEILCAANMEYARFIKANPSSTIELE